MPASDQVLLYHTKNGSLASRLTALQAIQQLSITDLSAQNPFSHVQSIAIDNSHLYVAYSNIVVSWDYRAGLPVHHWKIEAPQILSMEVYHDLLIICSKDSVITLSISDNTVSKAPMSTTLSHSCLVATQTPILCAASNAQCFLYSVKDAANAIFSYTHDHSITSLASNPPSEYSSNLCIAIGDTIGKITLLYLSPDSFNIQSRVSLHWHAHPVLSLSFDTGPSALYLLSGGQEAVLVQWDLTTHAKHQVLPRLGGPVAHIIAHSPFTGSGQYALSIKGRNTIRIIESGHGLRSHNAIHGPCASNSIIAIDQDLVLAHRGGLQFYHRYSGWRDFQEIVPQNYISKTGRSDDDEIYAQVEQIAHHDTWVAISDWNDQTGQGRLRFLMRDQYTLKERSIIEKPHNGARITGILLFGTVSCLTIGIDGAICLWALHRAEKQDWWSIKRQTKFQEDPTCVPVSFSLSPDQSTLSVLYQKTKRAFVTLWNSKTLDLLYAFEVGQQISGSSTVKFVNGRPDILLLNNAGTVSLHSCDTSVNTFMLLNVPGTKHQNIVLSCHPTRSIFATACFCPDIKKNLVLLWQLNPSISYSADVRDSVALIGSWSFGSRTTTIVDMVFINCGTDIDMVIHDSEGAIYRLGWRTSRQEMEGLARLVAEPATVSVNSASDSLTIENIDEYAMNMNGDYALSFLPSHALPGPDRLLLASLTKRMVNLQSTSDTISISSEEQDSQALKRHFLDLISRSSG